MVAVAGLVAMAACSSSDSAGGDPPDSLSEPGAVAGCERTFSGAESCSFTVPDGVTDLAIISRLVTDDGTGRSVLTMTQDGDEVPGGCATSGRAVCSGVVRAVVGTKVTCTVEGGPGRFSCAAVPAESLPTPTAPTAPTAPPAPPLPSEVTSPTAPPPPTFAPDERETPEEPDAPEPPPPPPPARG